MWKPDGQAFTEDDFQALAAQCGAPASMCKFNTWHELGDGTIKGTTWEATYCTPEERASIDALLGVFGGF